MKRCRRLGCVNQRYLLGQIFITRNVEDYNYNTTPGIGMMADCQSLAFRHRHSSIQGLCLKFASGIHNNLRMGVYLSNKKSKITLRWLTLKTWKYNFLLYLWTLLWPWKWVKVWTDNYDQCSIISCNLKDLSLTRNAKVVIYKVWECINYFHWIQVLCICMILSMFVCASQSYSLKSTACQPFQSKYNFQNDLAHIMTLKLGQGQTGMNR